MTFRTIARSLTLAAVLSIGGAGLIGCDDDSVSDNAHDAKNDMKDAAHDAKNNVKDAAHDVKNDVKDATH